MARLSVTTDDGRLVHAERVTADDFATEHFRAQLAQRLAWATEDAEALGDPGLDADARAGAAVEPLRPLAVA